MTPSPDRILKIGYAFREAKALLSAVELGIFGLLVHGALDADALATQIGIDRRGARDLFDALVALGLLVRGRDGRYANTAEGDFYLDPSKPTYIGDELDHLNARIYPSWNSLTAALRTGRPQRGPVADGGFAKLYADPVQLELFVKAMSGAALPPAQALADRFAWRDYHSFVDIGTAEGCLPVCIATAHRHLIGIGFDLPPVQRLFETYVTKRGLSARLTFAPGDFLCDPFPAADVIVLGRVLHNWPRETKQMLLARAYAALSPGGAIIVYERLIDDDRRVNAAGLLSSLNMLIMTDGGFDFTGAECVEWMQKAGFCDIRREPLTADQAMVVGRK